MSLEDRARHNLQRKAAEAAHHSEQQLQQKIDRLQRYLDGIQHAWDIFDTIDAEGQLDELRNLYNRYLRERGYRQGIEFPYPEPEKDRRDLLYSSAEELAAGDFYLADGDFDIGESLASRYSLDYTASGYEPNADKIDEKYYAPGARRGGKNVERTDTARGRIALSCGISLNPRLTLILPDSEGFVISVPSYQNPIDQDFIYRFDEEMATAAERFV